ncbi:MAG TPA: ATP-binding protein [Vicinamibacterales bacterium]|nr:ATP-binding protein [Vicinamibacterales bacterium]HOQ59164.1 ATP-binding protein [Vicinamibacterales bacterium]HPK71372.1 ATP-binding protein [Vicinamibacterales bacterium]
MGHVSPPAARAAIATALTRDTLVLLFYAVAVTEALIYSLPLMDPGTLTAFGASPFLIPFVATATAAGFYGLGRVQEREERLFWSHLAYACVFWLATLAAIAAVPVAQWRLIDDVLVDATYLFFYSPILFAAECKPHIPGVGPHRDVERQLRWAGVTLLVLGWFAYFVVTPAVLDPDRFGATASSAFLFMTLDVTIVVRFTWRAWTSGSTRWRVLYGTVALTGVALFATDTLDVLEGLRVFALADGALTDLLWAIPAFVLLLAFRLRDADLPRAIDPATHERAVSAGLEPVRVGSFLVGSALAFPLVHFAFHTAYPVLPALVATHRVIVTAELVLLGALGVIAFRHLEHNRVLAERRRAALEERVRRARTLEAVSRFAGVVAGEYSALVRVLGAFVDRAIDATGPGDPLHDEAIRAAEQVQRAADFTGNLQAISRQQRGHPVRVDVAAAVSERAHELRQILGPQILLEIAPSRGPCVAEIDPAHLRAMLLDLVTNARDAMPRGGRCRIETGAVDLDGDAAMGMGIHAGRFARLAVRDTGPGIPSEILPHIFEPFFSSKPGEGRGAGLGLATLYALASQYGGCVTAASGPGDTAFEILLPSAG